MDDVFTKPGDACMLEFLLDRYVFNKGASIQEEDNLAALGDGLPNGEKELFQLEAFPIFDIQDALSKINDREVLIKILKQSVSELVQKDIQEMSLLYANSNWAGIEKLAHKVKSGALYIGTQRLFYACQYLERYYKAGHTLMLDKLYKQLLSVNEETLKTVEEWLKNN